jgi:transcriptional regulator with XRE-family HTH domain
MVVVFERLYYSFNQIVIRRLNKMTIGEKILKLRTKDGLSQGTLAEFLDVSRQSISKWETGQAKPDVDKIVKLSEIFHVTVDYLVKDNDNLEDEQEIPAYEQNIITNEVEKDRDKIPGYFLMAVGLLLVGISFIFTVYAALLGIIVLIIGIEWLVVKNNLSLVIAWTIFLISVCIINPWTTSVGNTKWLIQAIMVGKFTAGIVIGIIQRVYGIILLFVTIKRVINHIK